MNIVVRCRKYVPEIIGIVLCVSLGMLSGFLAHASDSAWYIELHKPFFNPPSWVFAPVWTMLYGMIGLVGAMLWRKLPDNKNLMFLFCLQLVSNLAWSLIFFYAQRIDLALLDLLVLWLVLLIFMYVARAEKLLCMLFVPYIAWVSFALALNVTIFMMN